MVINLKKQKSTKTISDILKYYNCPGECDAHCCKREKIYISNNDYKDISRIHRTYVKNIKKSDNIEYGDHVLNYPCPLLKNNFCQVQKNKPWTCMIYPFKFANHIPLDHVALHPCPMGEEILAEYTIFRIQLCNHTIPDENAKKAIIKQNLEAAKEVIKDAKNFRSTLNTKELYIHKDMLHCFSEYLKFKHRWLNVKN